MTIDKIWEKIRNESDDIKDMVIASLEGQVEVRFKQILEKEIRKLAVTYDDGSIAEYCDLQLLSDESLQSEGLGKHSDPMLYRELTLTVDTFWVRTDYAYGNPEDEIYIEAVFRNGSPSIAAKELLPNIFNKFDVSEFIDITDSTLSNLRINRYGRIYRFPSVG